MMFFWGTDPATRAFKDKAFAKANIRESLTEQEKLH